MSKTEITQAVLALPPDERRELIRAVWESLALESDRTLSPEELSLIDERIREHEANPDDVVSWEEVEAELWPGPGR